jgi:hypothetical protein
MATQGGEQIGLADAQDNAEGFGGLQARRRVEALDDTRPEWVDGGGGGIATQGVRNREVEGVAGTRRWRNRGRRWGTAVLDDEHAVVAMAGERPVGGQVLRFPSSDLPTGNREPGPTARIALVLGVSPRGPEQQDRLPEHRGTICGRSDRASYSFEERQQASCCLDALLLRRTPQVRHETVTDVLNARANSAAAADHLTRRLAAGASDGAVWAR